MLSEKLKNHKIILASASPRRQQFFKDLDLEFEIRLKEIDEIYPEQLKAVEITDYLALLKSKSFEGCLNENEIFITSDTIVWHKEKALVKPNDYDEAFKMLQSLSNSTHQVITSVCFKTAKKTTVINDITEVTFKKLSSEEIHYYLDHYQPYDKAGSYGIQDWIGCIAVSKIEGSYFNVMGLPTHKVYQFLMDFAD